MLPNHAWRLACAALLAGSLAAAAYFAAGLAWPALPLLAVAGLAAAGLIAAGGEARPVPLDRVPEGLTVFYPRSVRDETHRSLADLRAGTYRLDVNCPETIGLTPDWRETPERSGYFLFNLHTLRFLYLPIEEAQRTGDDTGLDEALEVVLDWHAANPLRGAPRFYECFVDPSMTRLAPWLMPRRAGISGYVWGDEHSISWRAILIAYLWTLARTRGRSGGRWAGLLPIARQHARMAARRSMYRFESNHGGNNAMALLALGIAFRHDTPEARSWAGLGIARIEQQMRDNVSRDGVQLEQCGFYHAYTTTTFLEMARVADAIGRPLSPAYLERLDRMLAVLAYFAGPDGKVAGAPYSLPHFPTVRYAGEGVDRFPTDGAGAELFRAVRAGERLSEPLLCAEGGFLFLPAAAPDEFEILLHTRILQAGHGHQDALGLVIADGEGRAIVPFPSTLHVADADSDWGRYFHGPAAHNTVQPDDRPQTPLPWRGGRATAWLRSYKLNRLSWWLGLQEVWARLRHGLGGEPPPLTRRLLPENGEVLAADLSRDPLWLTVRHRTYGTAAHSRTLVRLDGNVVLMFDRMEGGRPATITSRIHFPVGAEVEVMPGGRVRCATPWGEAYDGFAAADGPAGASGSVEVACGRTEPRREGWYGRTPDIFDPMPVLCSRVEGREARFVWAMAPAGRECRVALDDAGAADRRTGATVTLDSGRTVHLEILPDGRVEVAERAKAGGGNEARAPSALEFQQ